jgi:hypothetical protein
MGRTYGQTPHEELIVCSKREEDESATVTSVTNTATE